MSKNAKIQNNSPTLDELLNSFWFSQSKTQAISSMLVAINILGTLLCSIIAFVFSQRGFTGPVFIYYRILCIIYTIHLIHSLSLGLLFATRFFPQINTYSNSVGIYPIFPKHNPTTRHWCHIKYCLCAPIQILLEASTRARSRK